jgi:hypothetical protein
MANDKASIWALLVGINNYKATDTIRSLRGCVNDVEAMHLFLINHLRVPTEQIKVLTNAEATRSGIIEAFQDFLINNVKIARGSQILFHYSGHGSQMPSRSKTEPDALDETIVPHDSRTKGVFDIPDKTLAGLIEKLAASKGNNISVILDSCHSGSGTRAVETGTRRIPADPRLPPADLDTDLRAESTTRGASPSGWAAAQANHVLLAGCRDSEESHEHQAAPGIIYGALTFFTIEFLKQLAPGASYGDLNERVAAHVNAIYRNQTPQCEGQRDREVFGGAIVERDPFILVREAKGNEVTLSAGLVHGMFVGTELALFSADVKTRAELPAEPLARAEVTSASATSAQAKVVDTPKASITALMRGVVTSQVYAGARHPVGLEAVAAADRGSLAQLGKLIDSSPYLQLNPEHADLRVQAQNGQFRILDGDGALLVVPSEDPLKTLHSLQSVSRYRTLQILMNKEAGSKLAGRIKLRLRKYVPGAEPKDMPFVQRPDGGELTLYYNEADQEGNKYVAEIVNESPKSIYAHLFYLNSEFAIERMYPGEGQQEKINAQGGVLYCGLPHSGGRALDIYLPDEPYWESSRDALKLIVTTEASDLKLLEQDGLEVPPSREVRGDRDARRNLSPINQLLCAVGSGAATRHNRPNQAITEDWGTAELSYRVARASQTKVLDCGSIKIELAPDITLKKPASFKGRIMLSTIEQTTRGIGDGPGVRPPPALAGLPETFQTVQRRSTRSLGSAGLVFDLETDEESRRSITTQNPLLLDFSGLAGEDAVDLLPIVFDGEDYFLVGHRSPHDTGAVTITELPKPVTTTRGAFNTIKLFIYKKIGRYTPQLGLRRAEVESGKAVYSPFERTQFKKGDTVAVFVHGFNSDTKWMVRDFAPWLRAEVLNYKHLLTYDYESFGTGVEEHGETLARALRQQCGFKAGDEIAVHTYAHSMGSLVSRCMIELSGGHEFVDRLVIAGPPNRGTTLGSTSRGMVYLFSSLINQVQSVPLLGTLNWLTEQLYETGLGWADMAVDAEITKKLNALEEPSNVSYLVLAGENTPDENQLARLQRLAHKVLDMSLDTLFGEQNDKVVGRSSMHGVRNGTYPKLTVEVVSCDHFGYLGDAQSRARIKNWVLA